jgi:ribosomal protein S18 acetylase RimI-like enzyme
LSGAIVFGNVAIDVHDDLPEAESRVVGAGLEAFNVAAAALQEVRPLTSFARLPTGELVGGAIARTWGRCCEVREVWVDETHRGRGIGSRLMRAVERRAAERGCSTFYLETWSFQARAFYERLGYAVRLAIEGYAPGIAKYVMVRDDGEAQGAPPTSAPGAVSPCD